MDTKFHNEVKQELIDNGVKFEEYGSATPYGPTPIRSRRQAARQTTMLSEFPEMDEHITMLRSQLEQSCDLADLRQITSAQQKKTKLAFQFQTDHDGIWEADITITITAKPAKLD